MTTPGTVLLRRHVRHNKSEPLVDEVELTSANPSYANIKHRDGRESTVSLGDLAPCPHESNSTNNSSTFNSNEVSSSDLYTPQLPAPIQFEEPPSESFCDPVTPVEPLTLRRSSRTIKPPQRLNL